MNEDDARDVAVALALLVGIVAAVAAAAVWVAAAGVRVVSRWAR